MTTDPKTPTEVSSAVEDLMAHMDDAGKASATKERRLLDLLIGDGDDGATEGGDPVVVNNRIRNNSYEGVWVYKDGKGRFENNVIRGNARGAWDIKDSPGVRRKGNKS